jgi:uncharacterized protein with ParB-like and HNH nuclease domain
MLKLIRQAAIAQNHMLAAYPSIRDIPQFKKAQKTLDIWWVDLEQNWLNNPNVNININPDYQRGYVWSQYQKEKYLEFIFHGGETGKDIYFNHPNNINDNGNSIWYDTYELVDGKQRLNAVIEFLNNKVLVFGKYKYQYKDFNIELKRIRYGFKFHINDLATKKEVVEWYLAMNNGGSIHTKEDLAIAYDVLWGCS